MKEKEVILQIFEMHCPTCAQRIEKGLSKVDGARVAVGIKLSKKTSQKIKQNLFWAFFYNRLTIPLAAGIIHFSAFESDQKSQRQQ